MNITTQTAEGKLNEATWRAVTQIKERLLLDSRNSDLVVFLQTQNPTGLRTHEYRVLQLLEEWKLINILSHDEGRDLDITTLSVNQPGFNDFCDKLYKAQKTWDLNTKQITPDTDLSELNFYWPENAGWVNELTFNFYEGAQLQFETQRSFIYRIFKRLSDSKGKWVSTLELSTIGGANLNQTISRLREKLARPPLNNLISINSFQEKTDRNTAKNTKYRILVRKTE